MTTTINASPTNGIVQTADGSGVMKLQSNGVTTNALAWVRFAGSSGTIASSYNVSSITRAAAGKYTLNFATATADSNYAPVVTASTDGSSTWTAGPQLFTTGGYPTTAPTTSSFVFGVLNNAYGAFVDPAYCSVVVFGN